MTTFSMDDCRTYGAFEEAKTRYENTSKRWKNAWWQVICDIWETFTEWQEKYFLDKVEKTIHAIITKKRRSRPRADIIEKIPMIFAKGTKLCYLFKFYNFDGNLIYSKVGTTTDTIRNRLSRELHDYRKNGDPISYAVVESVINTNKYWPEGAESYARAMFIKKFNEHYIKNDRFTCDIDVNEFNEMVKGYLA